MPKLKIFIIAFALSIIGLAANAQQAVTPAGGDAVGAGGSMSFTVGQIDFVTGSSAAGAMAQGVQQPYNNTEPTAPIVGPESLCEGLTTVYTDSTPGGYWSCSDTTVAVIDSVTGELTSISGGTTIVSYYVPGSGSIAVFTSITVDTLPHVGVIAGYSELCSGTEITLSNSPADGTWSSSDPDILTIDSASGVVTGVSAGTSEVSYIATNACGNDTATTTITVNDIPSAGTLTGTSAICEATSTSLSASVPEGTWSSSDNGVATVSGGVVSGISGGIAVISYGVTNECGSDYATHAMTVNPVVPEAGIVTGPNSVDTGATILLVNAVTGGTWSASNSNVTVSGIGLVTGVAAGTVTISYTVGNDCGSNVATKTVTVNIPLDTIAGGLTICVGATTGLSNSVVGGSWFTSNLSVAAVSSEGFVTGISEGAATITYVLSSNYVTATVSVYPMVSAITGTKEVCVDDFTELSSASEGGVWSSDNEAVATADPLTGWVTGVSAGTAVISYIAGCSTSAVVTVNAPPDGGIVSGDSVVCTSDTITLSNSVVGGEWISSDAGIATVGIESGIVTGVTSGTVAISYGVMNDCGLVFASRVVTVNPLPDAGTLSGTATVCPTATSELSSTVSGGAWASSNTSVSTVDTSGIVTGVTAGTSTISYTVTNSCGSATTTVNVTVNSLPDAGTISGASSVVADSSITLMPSVAGGSWSSSNTAVATVSSAGVVTPVSIGIDTINYTVTNSCGSDTVRKVITVIGSLPCYLPTLGLVAWYPFTGNAIDSSGNGNNGTIYGASLIADRFGNANSAYSFDGNSDFIKVLNSSSLSLTTSVTFSFWMNEPDHSLNSVGMIERNPIGMQTTPTQSGLQFETVDEISTCCGPQFAMQPYTGYVSYEDPVSLPLNSWIHIVGTYDGSTLKLYKNDTLLGVSSSTGTIDISSFTQDLFFGKEGLNGRFYKGYLDDIAIYNRALTLSEVTQLYNAGNVAGTITGSSSVCIGSTATLVDSVSGGTWSSSNTSIATVDSSGIVTGVSSGTSTISYTVSNECGTASATKIVTVNPLPNAGTISGDTTVVEGASITLTSSVSGGSWSSSSSAIATVGSDGVVIGVTTGSAVISYTVVNECGSASAAINVNVVSAFSESCFAWSNVGVGFSHGGGDFSMAISNDSEPYIAANTGSSLGITIKKYDGSDWVDVGSYSDVGGFYSDDVSIVLADDETPYVAVAYSPTSYPAEFKATVKKYNGASWESVGEIGFSEGDARIFRKSLAIDNGGSLYLAYRDGANDNKVTVMKYDESEWAVVGTPGFSVGGASFISVVFDYSGTPYVAFNDEAFGEKATVMKFNGASWEALGGYGFSPGGVGYPSLQIDSSNNVFLAFGDGSIEGHPASLMKWSGSTWTYVGSPGFSESGVFYTSLALDRYGRPYVAYSDGGSLEVMKHNGEHWASIWSPLVEDGQYANIAFDSIGSLFAAQYHDEFHVFKYSDGISEITGPSVFCSDGGVVLSTLTIGGTWSSSDTSVAEIVFAGYVEGRSAGSAIISYVVGGCNETYEVTVNPAPEAGSLYGDTTLMEGEVITLSSSVIGGSWISSDTTVAAVGTDGVVTGVAAGSVVVFYFVSNSCGTDVATHAITVTTACSLSAITGTMEVCVDDFTELSSATEGGVWSSDNEAVATIDASTGWVTGVSAGTAVISYTAGCSTSTVVTVNAPPDGGVVSGDSVVCTSDTITLSNSVVGGEWISSDAGIATVGSASGIVTGVTSGTVAISYGVMNDCGLVFASRVVTVNPLPDAGSLSGTTTVCPTATSELNSTVSGGAWESSNTSIATVDTSGIVTGVTAGTSTISYTVTNSCGSATTTVEVTVNPLPDAGSLSGTFAVCPTATTELSSTVSGGAWESSNISIATVDTSGIVTGVMAGSSTISYTVTTSCGSATTTVDVTVNPLPDAGALSGTTTVCPTATTELSSTVSGGAWESSNISIATVDTSGIVAGVATGTTTVSYTVSSECGSSVAMKVITVNPLPDAGTITGETSVCVGNTITLTDTVAGGVWSNSDPGILTIDAVSGIVTGVSAGTSVVSYIATNSCGSDTAISIITVIDAPSAGSVSGVSEVCEAASVSLFASVADGVWSSSDGGVAEVSEGVVTGISGGIAVISYGVTNECGSDYATHAMTVNPVVPEAGIVTGPNSVDTGATILLVNAVTGGTWSASNSNATVSGIGLVTGVAAGTVTISYTVGNDCGSNVATKTVTVNIPLDTIAGGLTVCVGATTALSNSVVGGSWFTSNLSVAAVSSEGFVTGISEGAATITYVLSSNYVTATVSVYPMVSAITGTKEVCVDDFTELSSATEGGVWSSDNEAVATADALTGWVTGVSAGTAVISYTAGCSTSTVVTVNAPPDGGVVSGDSVVCTSDTITLSNSVVGGEWISSDAGIATVGSASGIVTGVTSGTVAISYGVMNDCGLAFASRVVTVNLSPDAGAITGSNTVCESSTIALSDTASGGEWSSSDAGVASVGGTGVVTGISSGTVLISYTATTSCGGETATKAITVNATPDAGTITGANIVCESSTIALSDTANGGVWTSSDDGVATVASTGVVSGISSGAVTISYTFTNDCGSAFATHPVTVNPLPVAGNITGTNVLCGGGTITLSDTATGGAWSSSDTGVATVDGTGVVSGVSAGAVVISYTDSNICGTEVATHSVTVNPSPDAGTITGADEVCEGSSITLSDAASGGTWSSSDDGIATVGSTGVVSGLLSGTATISYSHSTECGSVFVTHVVAVNPLPVAGTISGLDVVCEGSIIALTETATAGEWSSSNTEVATVDSAGVVTGESAGAVVISYTDSNSCGTEVATHSVTVNASSDAGTITGADEVCEGSSITLSDAIDGGVWSSSNSGIALVGSTGVVTGSSPGTVTISYVVSGSCGSAVTTKDITVNPTGSVGTITGAPSLCLGYTTTLSGSVSGGDWSSSNTGVATVSSTGVVTGVAMGTTVISYVITTDCGSTLATKTLTVNLSLPYAGEIAGLSSVIIDSTITLSDSVSGGEWSSADTSVAVVDAGGVVTGVASGTVVISYTVVSGCGSTAATKTITVNATPSIIGNLWVCPGSTTTLTGYPSGGTWSSSNPSIASVGVASGVVSGHVLGTVTISYTVSATTYTALFTVGLPPIEGATNLCVGDITLLTNDAVGGVWSSSNPFKATIDAASGEALGVEPGLVTMIYTMEPGCFSTKFLGVRNPPFDITGGGSVCVGSNVLLSNSVFGAGTPYWSSSNPSVATISSGGSTVMVTGVAQGTAIITYTAGSGCFTTRTETVNASPSALSGPSSVCVGAYVTMGSSPDGGTWSSSHSSATIDAASGVVTGVSGGHTFITYTLPVGCYASRFLNVINDSLPNAGSISGSGEVCESSTITLSDAAVGGFWSSSDGGVATVSSTGLVSGVVAGVASISYTVTNGCGSVSAAHTVAVNSFPSAGSIEGASIVCEGNMITLSDTAIGGEWSCSDSAVALVSDAGIVTGVSSGIATVSYAVTNSCGSDIATSAVTVENLPDVGTITGVEVVCEGSTVVLSEDVSGGVWASSDSSIAIVTSTGSVLGLSPGTVTISYVVSGSCGSAVTTKDITVNPTGSAGTISGAPSLCLGYTTTLSGSVSGGDWSSSNTGVATVSSTGVVTGVAMGTTVISYVITTDCGSTLATKTLTVNLSLPYAGEIAGLSSVIIDSTITLSDSVSGGEWSSADTSVAVVDAGGVVTGVASGTVVISYTVVSGCGSTAATKTITVNATPSIIGNLWVCPGSTTTLTGYPSGGTWSSSNPSIASVGVASGVVSGHVLGTVTISYTVSATTYTALFTVGLPPIEGATNLCVGDITLLTNDAVGGVWSSSNPFKATIDAASGEALGVEPGLVTMIYTMEPGCFSTKFLGVRNPPFDITGGGSVCVGSNVLLSNSVFGAGTPYWSSSNPSVATISSGGSTVMVTGVAQGTAIITYTAGSGCFTTRTETVNASPSALIGPGYVCTGATVAMGSSPDGGTWSSSHSSATIDAASGVVTGVSGGHTFITYTLPNGCRSFRYLGVVFSPYVISGWSEVGVGASVPLLSGPYGGVWSSSSTSIATVTSSGGVVTGVSAGSVLISYTSPSSGCYRTKEIEVIGSGKPGRSAIDGSDDEHSFRVFPNPTSGSVSVSSDKSGILILYTVDGKKVTDYEVSIGQMSILLPENIVSGAYLCVFVRDDGTAEMVTLVYER